MSLSKKPIKRRLTIPDVMDLDDIELAKPPASFPLFVVVLDEVGVVVVADVDVDVDVDIDVFLRRLLSSVLLLDLLDWSFGVLETMELDFGFRSCLCCCCCFILEVMDMFLLVLY